MKDVSEIRLKSAEFCELTAEVMRSSNSIRFRALGSSMSPFLREGSILTVSRIDVENVSLGDILFYRSPEGQALAHRVIWRRGSGSARLFLIRADSSRAECERVSASQVLGRVVRVENCNGKAFDPATPCRRATGLWWALTPWFGRRLTARIARVLRLR